MHKLEPGWEIGDTLKGRRQFVGWTQASLALEAGIHPSIISRIELGDRRATADILCKLAAPLGFQVIELLRIAGYLEKEKE